MRRIVMQATHTLAIATFCALALVACKETPPPSDKTAMTTPEAMAVTTHEPPSTEPISSPALPGPLGSDATPAPQPVTSALSESQPPTGEATTPAKSDE